MKGTYRERQMIRMPVCGQRAPFTPDRTGPNPLRRTGRERGTGGGLKATLFDEPLGLARGEADQPGVGERGDCEEDGVEQRGEGEGRAEVRGAGEGQHVVVED